MAAGNDTSDLERRLAEVELLRRRVLNVIPHALRTPITTLRGLAEAMASATDEEIRKDIVPALRRLAAQAEHLVDDLLIASGYTTALPTSAPHPTEVGSAVRTVWSEVGGAGSIEVEGDESTKVVAPAGSLEKMLHHVLDNAAKYGEGPPRVRVAETGDGKVTIEITSTGSVPPDLGILVEPFYRAESAVMRSSGLGVGLTVADALATQAGGSLEVSEAPDGSGLVTRLVLTSGRSG